MNREDSAEDLLLIRQVLSGKKEYFGVLIDKYKTPIYNLAYRMTGNRFDAEDIAQESFLRAYTHLNNFRVNFKFFDWLYTITLNVARNALKKRGRMRVVPIDKPIESQNGTMTRQIPDQKAGPEALFMKKESEQFIWQILGSIPVKYRMPFILKYIEQQTYEEISKLMKLPLGTAKTRIHRARKLLFKYRKRFKNGTF